MEKPITIIRSEFMEELNSLIDNSNLPPFILEPIFRDVYNMIRNAEIRQLEYDKQKYQEALIKEAYDNELEKIEESI